MIGMRLGMDMAPRQDQKMILAPRMIQSMEILQLPIADLQAKIEKELEKFDATLLERPRWLVLNKIDLLPEDEREKRAKAIVKKLKWKAPWFAVSAATGDGTLPVVQQAMRLIDELHRDEVEARNG